MKIAISAMRPDVEANVDERFGRAHSFMIYDSDSDSWQSIENNPNLNAVQGAGIQTAQMLANSGAQVLLTGHCGPKAFRVLGAAGIKVYTGCSGSISQTLAAFQSGELKPAENADVQGHW
ncbi:NifB/NifX family molybdenum-iron cluster-binding protein [bacterium]|nr:NifB/NifX family molybdenum-iron cluster-binding protein [bacterium]